MPPGLAKTGAYPRAEPKNIENQPFSPRAPARMTPATAKFFEAVMNRTLTHSGDPRLGRHVRNAVLKVDARGQRITKENRNSTRKIDLAVAATVALDRATTAIAPTYNVLDAFGESISLYATFPR